MRRLQRIFRRAALALALLTTGLAGGYALHDPGAALAQPCRAAAASDTQRNYGWTRTADNAAHSDCSCGNA